MDKIQLAQNLINSLLNETRKSAIAPRQLASIYQHILDIVAVDDEARDQAVRDARTAASGAQQTLEQMQTITLQAAEDIGTVEILPTQSGAKTSNQAFKKALEAVKQGKSVTGILTTDGKYMRITNAIRSNKGNGIDDLRLEGVASNCGSDKLAFFFIRVIVHIEENKAEMTYDSTGIKSLEISLKEAYSMDVRNLIYKKDIDKLSPDTIVHKSDLDPLQELKSILGSYINFDFGFNGNTLTDEDSQFFSNPFDIAELSVLSDSMGLSGTECLTCNVIMDITETESVMFPCVFKRNRQDEESMWEITGEGTFSRNDGSVWRIFIDAMPENNDMDVEFQRLYSAATHFDKAFEPLWIQAGNMNGFKFTSVDWSNKEKPYECNGIRLTREEALKTYILKDNPWMGTNGVNTWTCVKLVTNLMSTYRFVGVTLNGYSSTIDYFRIAPNNKNCIAALDSGGHHAFPNCIEILGSFQDKRDLDFSACARLKKMKLHGLTYDKILSPCWLLDLESFRYMIDNAENTTALTIRVHKTVFNRLSSESNAEWHQVMLDASERNISFVSAS